MKPNTKYLTPDGHITDETAALMAESFAVGRTPDVPDQVTCHLQDCIECKDKILEISSFLRNPDIPKIFNPKHQDTHSWYFYRGKIAAVFVVFALLLSAFYFLSRETLLFNFQGKNLSNTHSTDMNSQNASQVHSNDQIPNTVSKSGETLSNPGRDTLPGSATFDVNPNLEIMIGGQLRGTSIQAFTPSNNSIAKSPIHFSWKKESVSSNTLRIVTNKNKTVFSHTTTGDSFDFREKLSPGLYYWKIESKDELLYVGKFFIAPSKRLHP